MVKDTTKKKNIFQKVSKNPNDTGRITNSNRLSAKTQLGEAENTQNQHLWKNSEVLKTSNILIYQIWERCQKA